ncbi:uncharacterized protein LOC132903816 [Amyelois transitella]|uniref:uncharacterized protein LOC132903816 n=2 Tax=Amyelois transitella TaxID=680683 RepID=UPI00298FEB0D|nr:uncharacterized protein LOC132903816 [Amyelois transitella]
MTVICYADDTMVAIWGEKLESTLRTAAVAADLMVTRVRLLGLRVALSKCEVIVFGKRGWKPPEGASIPIGGERVQVKPYIKYLGITMDPRWDFREHFKQLAPRIVGAASAMGRLLPNVGGPSARCRKLYAGVARSMALYGAPIWADKLSRANVAQLRRPQRVVANRIARAYVTVSLEDWMDRKYGQLTYRMTQVMTGHGCFGHYLHTIGREPSPVCHECGEPDDTAQHTLAECERWATERVALAVALGDRDLTLHCIVSKMLGSERCWDAMSCFCETVMSQKETAEREREARAEALPCRRGRRGRRRAQYARRLP